jgi:hypothetical protein
VSDRSPRARTEISATGRVAGLTVGACVTIAGVAFLVASWDELTCRPAGERCDDLAGVGGAVSFAALAATIAGVSILVHTWRRPVVEGASSAWTWGLGIVFCLGVLAIGGLIPSHTCPGEARLSPAFATCVDGAERFEATSWLWPKRALWLAGLALGFTVMRSPRRVWLTAPVAAVVWLAGTGWLLWETMVTGLPR